MSQSIPVALFLEDGTTKILAVYDNYADADRAVDIFSEMYPNGWVDILDGALAA